MDQVAICNLALGWLGSAHITAITDPVVPAQLCNDNWDAVRDAVLEARAWTFAVERASLAADPVPPVAGWTQRYQIPSDCLRVLSADFGDDSNDIEWQREGQFVVCDETGPIFIRYLKRVEDTLEWSPTFAMAMAHRLAAILSTTLTENRSLQADLWKLYAVALKEAASLDGMQGRSEPRARVSSIRSRRA